MARQRTMRSFFAPAGGGADGGGGGGGGDSPAELAETLGGIVPTWRARSADDAASEGEAMPPSAGAEGGGHDGGSGSEDGSADDSEDGLFRRASAPTTPVTYTSRGKRARYSSQDGGASSFLGGDDACGEAAMAHTPQVFSRRKRAGARAAHLLDKHGEGARAGAGAAAAPAGRAESSANPRRASTQTFLDLGQANFGAITCATCGCVYVKGVPDDERAHAAMHDAVMLGPRFPGWKAERVLRLFEPKYAAPSSFERGAGAASKARVVAVLPTDAAAHVRKAGEIAEIVSKDLGLTKEWLKETPCTVLLYVSGAKRVVGAVFAERLSKACRALPAGASEQGSDGAGAELSMGPTRCSAESVPCAVGVRAVWTHASARRRGVATRLLDELRGALRAGVIAERAALAFSQPTAEGAALARRFTGLDEYLVYAS